MGIGVGTMLALSSAISAASVIGSSVIQAQNNANAAKQKFQQSARTTRLRISDRMREAQQDIGTIRAMEFGSSGMRNRMLTELAYIEGIDLARINQVNQSQQQNISQATSAANKALFANTALSVAQTGLTVWSSNQAHNITQLARKQKLKYLQNTYKNFN